MLVDHFATVRLIHVGCVALSGTLFCARGVLRLLEQPLANAAVVRYVTYIVDSMLLGAAIVLMLIIHQYPFTADWLTMKLVLLFVYIGLGILALRRAQHPSARLVAFIAALATYFWIIGIAMTRRPTAWLTW